MNHDYAHCADYNTETCPETCFRGQLVRDYRERELGVPVSWMSFKGTAECKEYCRKQTNADMIRNMTDEELARYLCDISACDYCPVFKECVYTDNNDRSLLEWLRSEADG